jgi:archaellum component FlaF (FlaF/FlaG flagellin family)
MGFSVSAATAIIVTGLVLMAGVLSTVAFQALDDIKDAALDTSDTELARARTRIEVLNASYTPTRVYLNVSNTGETTLDTALVDVLLNGTIATEDVVAKKVGGLASEVWGVHEVMYVEVGYTKGNNSTRIVVVTENGVTVSRIMK